MNEKHFAGAGGNLIDFLKPTGFYTPFIDAITSCIHCGI
jgi:hypothetical protein